MQCRSLGEVERFARSRGVGGHEPAHEELCALLGYLESLGKGAYCRFDIGVVRGLAYYTGPVFEIYDRRAKLRALCGGGRYDRLMETMGGQAMPAVGFGLGDVVLGELLDELGKRPPAEAPIEYHIIPLEEPRLADAARLAQKLRASGRRADYAMRAGGLRKAMKRAADAGAAHVVFLGGREWEAGRLRVRDMASGREREVGLDEFLRQ